MGRGPASKRQSRRGRLWLRGQGCLWVQEQLLEVLHLDTDPSAVGTESGCPVRRASQLYSSRSPVEPPSETTLRCRSSWRDRRRRRLHATGELQDLPGRSNLGGRVERRPGSPRSPDRRGCAPGLLAPCHLDQELRRASADGAWIRTPSPEADESRPSTTEARSSRGQTVIPHGIDRAGPGGDPEARRRSDARRGAHRALKPGPGGPPHSEIEHQVTLGTRAADQDVPRRRWIERIGAGRQRSRR